MVFSKPSATLKSLLTSLFTKHSRPLLSNTHTKSTENTLLRNLASKILITSLGYKRSKTGRVKRPSDHVVSARSENVKGLLKLPIKNLLPESSRPASYHSITRGKDARKKKNGLNTTSHYRISTLTVRNKTSSHRHNASDNAREARVHRRREMRYMGYLVNRLNEFYANISRMNATSTRTSNIVHVPFRRREVNKLNQLFSSLVKQEADLYAQNRSKLGAMSRSKLRSFSNLLKQLRSLPNGTARQVQFDLIIDSHNSTRKDFVVMDDMGAPRSPNMAEYPGDPVNDNVGNHLSDVDERSCYDCTMPTDSYVPDSRENDKLAQYILSQDILSVNNKLRGYASKYQHWNVHDDDFDEPIRSRYGAPRNDYGPPRNDYGAPRNNYGALRSQYGAPRNGYAPLRQGYGASRNDYGTLRNYGSPRNDFEGSRNVFGEPKGRYAGLQNSYRGSPLGELRTNYGHSRNEYAAPKIAYGSASNTYGEARHSYGNQRGPIHVMADGKNHYLSEYKQSTLDNDRDHATVDDRHHAVALAEYSDNSLVYGNRNNPFFGSSGNNAAPSNYRNQALLSNGGRQNNGIYQTNLRFGRLPERHEYRPKQYPVGLPEFTGETRNHHPSGTYHNGSGRNNRVVGRNPYQEELDIGLTRGITEHQFEEQRADDFQLVDKVVNEIFYRNPLSQHGGFDADYFPRQSFPQAEKETLSKISVFQ